jgi:hypothetical protein
MKRLLLRLVALAIMAALMLALAIPAFAAPRNETAPNCLRGQATAAFNQPTFEGFVKHFDRALGQCGGELLP